MKGTSGNVVENNKIEQAVRGLKILLQKGHKKKKIAPLLADSDKQQIFLQIGLNKIPVVDYPKTLKLKIPNPLIQDLQDVCLIVHDSNLKNIDHDKTVAHFRKLLSDNGITVGEIIPYRQLRAEHKQFEALRHLSEAFEFFLADGRLSKMLPAALGKHFLSKRKLPLLVNFNVKDLKKEFSSAISKTTLTISGHGTILSTQAATSAMDASQIIENLRSIVAQLGSVLPGGWNNVASLHLKSRTSVAVPIYLSTISPNDVKVPFLVSSKPEPVIDELNTLTQSKIKVFASGDIELIRTQKAGLRNEVSNFEDLLIEESEMKRRKRLKTENGRNKKVADNLRAHSVFEDDKPSQDLNKSITPKQKLKELARNRSINKKEALKSGQTFLTKQEMIENAMNLQIKQVARPRFARKAKKNA